MFSIGIADSSAQNIGVQEQGGMKINHLTLWYIRNPCLSNSLLELSPLMFFKCKTSCVLGSDPSDLYDIIHVFD